MGRRRLNVQLDAAAGDVQHITHPPHIADSRIRALLAAISPKRQGAKAAARDRALLKVLASTGVRCAELCGLRWCDIDFDTNRVDVRAATAKGRRSRVVFLGAEAKTAVVRWRQVCPTTDQDPKTDESSVFVGRRGQPLGVIGVQQVLRRLCDAAGIRPLRPHAWRRFFASQSLAAGMDVLRLQQLMGHRSLQMTSTYITITWAQLSQAVAEHGAVEFALRAK